MFRTKKKTPHPDFPVAPAAQNNEGCELVFGHNAAIKKVLMQFSVSCDRLVFTPEQAEQVAQQLTTQAAQARGAR